MAPGPPYLRQTIDEVVGLPAVPAVSDQSHGVQVGIHPCHFVWVRGDTAAHTSARGILGFPDGVQILSQRKPALVQLCLTVAAAEVGKVAAGPEASVAPGQYV